MIGYCNKLNSEVISEADCYRCKDVDLTCCRYWRDSFEFRSLQDITGECAICKGAIDNLSANPEAWGVQLPYFNGNGKLKYYHMGCVVKAVNEFTKKDSSSEVL
jgi:hypothetical protein